MKLVTNIKSNEGFSGTVYKDTEGFDTIGYGTKLPISKGLATVMLQYELDLVTEELLQAKPFISSLDTKAQDILFQMAYQMGVPHLLDFGKTLGFLAIKDYKKASVEMLDSKWALQTPNRAFRLSQRMKAI